MPDRSEQIVAIKPVADASNAFVALFAKAVADQGFQIRDFNWRDVAEGKADVAILHWPYELTGLGGMSGVRRCLAAYRTLGKARKRGTRFIWVAHNAQPHDAGRISGFLMRRFVTSIDGIIPLSAHSAELVHSLYPRSLALPEAQTVHGHYLDVFKTPVQPPARKSDQVRLGYFGQIRAYKNVETLAKIVARMPRHINLSVTGRGTHSGIVADLQSIAADAGNVVLDIRPDALSDEEVERAVDQADGVVLPYRAILNSGAAIFALSRARPVLAPNTGSLPELQAIVGSDWLHLYDGEISVDAVEKFADWLKHKPNLERPDLSRLSWARVGKDIAGLIDRLTA